MTGLEVATKDRWRRAGRRRSARRDSSAIPYRTEDWQAQNSSLFQALKLEKLGMTFILMLIILVAAFNIVGTLTMVVADKTQGDRHPARDGDAGGVDPPDLPGAGDHDRRGRHGARAACSGSATAIALGHTTS